jgi:hypothetical protein
MSIYFGELPDDDATARRIYETGPFTVEVDGNRTEMAPKSPASRRKTARKSKAAQKKHVKR